MLRSDFGAVRYLQISLEVIEVGVGEARTSRRSAVNVCARDRIFGEVEQVLQAKENKNQGNGTHRRQDRHLRGSGKVLIVVRDQNRLVQTSVP